MNRLEAMDAFVRVVETGSFSAAAVHLRLGQPAVSKAIAQLEERIGMRLLFRSSRALTITEAGLTFYERAKQVIELAEEAEQAARGTEARLTGRLRFSAPVTFARLHLMPVLPSFMRLHPDLRIQAVLDDRTINPVEESIDIGLRLGHLADSALVARRIGRCDRLVIGIPTYFSKIGIPETPMDLAAHQAVIYSGSGGGSTWSFKKDSTATTVTLTEHILVTAAEGVREAVFAGLGCVIGSEWMFRSELQSGRVVAVLRDWSLEPMDLWAVLPTGRQISPKSRAFADFVKSAMEGNIDLHAPEES